MRTTLLAAGVLLLGLGGCDLPTYPRSPAPSAQFGRLDRPRLELKSRPLMALGLGDWMALKTLRAQFDRMKNRTPNWTSVVWPSHGVPPTLSLSRSRAASYPNKNGVYLQAPTDVARFDHTVGTDLSQNFDTDMAGFFDASHTGGSVTRTTTWPRNGTHSLEFTTPAQMYKRASIGKPFSWDARVRTVEIWFYLEPGSPPANFEVAMEGWDGTHAHFASFIHKNNLAYPYLNGWRFWQDGPGIGQWQFLPGVGKGYPAPAPGKWHRLRLKVDYALREYVSFQLDNELMIDLRGQKYAVPLEAARPSWIVSMLAWAQTNVSVKMFVDDMTVECKREPGTRN